MVALDLGDIPPETVRYVPLNAWFRFRRAVEDTPTIFMVLEQESNAKTCASLVLRMEERAAEWCRTSSSGDRMEEIFRHPYACLFDGAAIRMEVMRMQSRVATEIQREKTLNHR